MTDISGALKDFILAVQTAGPLGVVFFLWWQNQRDRKSDERARLEENRRWEEKHQAVVKMYESNVELVDRYGDLIRRHEERGRAYEIVVKDYKELVMLTTSVITELKDIIKHNLYCPMVRKETRPREDAIR